MSVQWPDLPRLSFQQSADEITTAVSHATEDDAPCVLWKPPPSASSANRKLPGTKSNSALARSGTLGAILGMQNRLLKHQIVAIAAALQLASPTSARAPLGKANTAELFSSIRDQDLRLSTIMRRLITGNAAICSNQMPFTGFILHAQSQYDTRFAASLAQAGYFPAPVAVELVLPDSPAAAASLKVGDGIVAINSIALPLVGSAKRSSMDRDKAERLLLMQSADAPIKITIQRTGEPAPRVVTLHPQRTCRARWEVTFDKSDLGLSDGEIVQLSGHFLDDQTDDFVAVIAAHELAHLVLGHRQKLESLNVKYTALSAYGRSGKLIRAAEDEADRMSVHLLINAGYNPERAVQFWEGPGKRYSGGILRSPTHSSASARAATIRREIEGLATLSGSNAKGQDQ